MSEEFRVIINHEAVHSFMRLPDGPVARRMLVVGEAVRARTIKSLKPGFPRDFLGPTIVKRTVMTDHGPAVQVGSAHIKTRPHIIRGNPYLAFTSRKTGKLVVTRMVHHPGSDFTNYLSKKLTDALDAVKGTL